MCCSMAIKLVSPWQIILVENHGNCTVCNMANHICYISCENFGVGGEMEGQMHGIVLVYGIAN